MSEDIKSCATCKHWNNRDLEGCDLYEADTGEILHYYGNEETPCPNWKKRDELK